MEHRSQKKEHETQCLHKTIKLGLKQHGKSLRIIQKLESADFDDNEHERPDFIKLYDMAQIQSPILVGIEHFSVDRMSLLKKNGKVASVGRVEDHNLKKLYNKYHEDVIHDNIPEEIYSDIGRYIAQYTENQKCSSYSTLIESFKYSLKLHLDSADEYRANLRSISHGKYPIELIFLVEIHADFYGLYRADDHGIKKQKDTLMPIFEDLVQYMEDNINPKKVDYIVLCIENELGCGDYKVVAFRTKNIRKELERQGVRIYEYVGEDLLLPKFTAREKKISVESQCDLIEGGANIQWCLPKSSIEDVEGVIQLMIRACHLMESGKNVMMTSAVYGCLPVLFDKEK